MDSVTDDRLLICRVSPFGNLRIDAYVPLPEAYRSLSRPSSAPDAKAFPLCSFSLNLVAADSVHSVSPARLAALRENCISLRRNSSPKQNGRFVSVWVSLGSQNYAGSYRIILHEIVLPINSSTIASEFPSVALLVFPLFSFQCAAVDAPSSRDAEG